MLKMSSFNKRRRNNSIEARCTHNGKAISLSARTHKLLDEKIRNYVKTYNEQYRANGKPEAQVQSPAPAPANNVVSVEEPKQKRVLFKDYATEYFMVAKQGDVSDGWYKRQIAKMNRYVFSVVGDKYFDEISILDCKEILNVIKSKGLSHTWEDVHNILKQIFDYAVYDGIVRLNPMHKIKFQRHKRNHYRCMTLDEERKLLDLCRGTKYERNVVLMLYAGLRPGECATATLGEKFIVANNSKRKNSETELKYIPITPMMRKHVDAISRNVEWGTQKAVELWLAEQDLEITPYCCRHTFNTRAAKCKIMKEFRELAMGHSCNSINVDTYTHYDDEDLMATYFDEFQKFLYEV